MKRTRLKKKSKRGLLEEECDGLHLQILRRERGFKCEVCGKEDPNVGRFHILSIGSHPRLRYSSLNILLSCWMPCHYNWHHSFEKAKLIEKRIIEIRGKDYKTELLIVERVTERLTYMRLGFIKLAFRALLDRADKEEK